MSGVAGHCSTRRPPSSVRRARASGENAPYLCGLLHIIYTLALAMTSLPSYQEAVARSDWLEIAGPYVPVRDYASLCLVSRRFYNQFAPRLWIDPIRMVRLLGLDPGDGVIARLPPRRDRC